MLLQMEQLPQTLKPCGGGSATELRTGFRLVTASRRRLAPSHASQFLHPTHPPWGGQRLALLQIISELRSRSSAAACYTSAALLANRGTVPTVRFADGSGQRSTLSQPLSMRTDRRAAMLITRRRVTRSGVTRPHSSVTRLFSSVTRLHSSVASAHGSLMRLRERCRRAGKRRRCAARGWGALKG
jgi:hypothetical protein